MEGGDARGVKFSAPHSPPPHPTPTPAPPPKVTTTGGMLIAVGILLCALLAGLAYLWLRIKGLRLDPAAYSSLRGGPDEGGDLPPPNM